MKNKDTQLLEEAYKRVHLLKEEEDYELEGEEAGSEIAVEIYLRRESDDMDPEKQQAFASIKSKLEAKGYAVEPYKSTLKNGSAVLELTVHTSMDWNEAVDSNIEEMLQEYEFKAVYMLGYPE
jgi:predicted RND superfamily exporter protein